MNKEKELSDSILVKGVNVQILWPHKKIDRTVPNKKDIKLKNEDNSNAEVREVNVY